MSIYEGLQREQGISVAVNEFYERVLGDPELVHYFAGVDLPRLRAHQVKLLAQVTGGPQHYAGRSLVDAHRGLAISDQDFDHVVGHLADTLSSLDVPDDVIAQIAAALGAHRADIVAAPELVA